MHRGGNSNSPLRLYLLKHPHKNHPVGKALYINIIGVKGRQGLAGKVKLLQKPLSPSPSLPHISPYSLQYLVQKASYSLLSQPGITLPATSTRMSTSREKSCLKVGRNEKPHLMDIQNAPLQHKNLEFLPLTGNIHKSLKEIGREYQPFWMWEAGCWRQNQLSITFLPKGRLFTSITKKRISMANSINRNVSGIGYVFLK